MPSINPITPDAVKATSLSLESARGRLAGKTGQRYWRSLEELAGTPEFKSMVDKEFPKFSAAWDPLDRRDFLRLMGASLALGGLTACTRQPAEKIVPYVDPPENLVPGVPLFYATAMTLGGYGYGMLVESHMGRPTKAEGNPEHPASLGGTDVIGQASVLDLYDPDRSQVVKHLGRVSSWERMGEAITAELEAIEIDGGEGLCLLTETVTSPTLIDQMTALLAKYPKARWIQYDPVNRDQVYEGSRVALGEAADSVYRLDKADVILSLDADFLGAGPGHIRYAHDFGARRKVGEGARPNRLYVVETATSITGGSADHRFAASPAQVEAFARAVAAGLGVQAAQGDVHGLEKWIAAVVKDLKAHRGKAVVIPGDQQPAVVHALAHAINNAIGAFGSTVVHVEPASASTASQTAAITSLASDMHHGKVRLLVVMGGNPVYNAPVEAGFADALSKVRTVVRLGMHEDETSRLAHWHAAEAHFLEAWSDVRSFDGSVSIVQPLVEPLYGGKSSHELVSGLLGRFARSGHEIVTDYWKKRLGGDYDAVWRRSLHDGMVAGTASAPRTLAVKPGVASAPPATAEKGDLELVLVPDFGVWDGRFANNAWLQELPRPITTLTWDNALHVNGLTAAALGLQSSDVVEVSVGEQRVSVPVLVTVGVADHCGVLHLGYGRVQSGRVGNGVGADAYPLRAAGTPSAVSARVSRTGATYPISVVQEHHTMQGRHHYRSGTVGQFQEHPDFVQDYEEFDVIKSVYPKHDYTKGPQWGMVIDLSACIGCNACLVACQSENNIPVVGKDQISRGRDMYWIRVDRYYEGNEANAQVHHQPVTCMHCENAPCEAVCPVAATVHGIDGINQMVYNRCVGTRYCANNCPYKVRRFNFYKFADHETPSLKLQRNPDVTVRSRGVMEKCTYCVQRISAARITARREDRPIADGEVVTACQQVCPTRAITFGDILDANSRVAKAKASPLNYSMLSELATVPRTTYLARITNPNPELETVSATESHGHGS